jgi:hypothetical protein
MTLESKVRVSFGGRKVCMKYERQSILVISCSGSFSFHVKRDPVREKDVYNN